MLLGSNPARYAGSTALEIKLLEGMGGGSGTALMQAAYQESLARGYGGAIVLQAAPDAVPFYQ
jgi:hypothetical protein